MQDSTAIFLISGRERFPSLNPSAYFLLAESISEFKSVRDFNTFQK